jgi:hypothetical protein
MNFFAAYEEFMCNDHTGFLLTAHGLDLGAVRLPNIGSGVNPVRVCTGTQRYSYRKRR